jgi:hypothetical protein
MHHVAQDKDHRLQADVSTGTGLLASQGALGSVEFTHHDMLVSSVPWSSHIMTCW